MFGALPIIALNVYAIIDDKLNEKKKKEQEQKKKEQNKDWMYQQREQNELGADYFSYQGYHPPKK